jgi:hypothetical protein
LADFKDEGDQFDYDQYGMVHLAFCSAVPDSLMAELFKSQKLINKVVSFIEINMDFSVITDNAFLTKIAPFQTKLPKDKAKDHAGYEYTKNPNDDEIKANRYDLATGS